MGASSIYNITFVVIERKQTYRSTRHLDLVEGFYGIKLHMATRIKILGTAIFCRKACRHIVDDVLYAKPLYVGHLESKERLRIQPAQLFNFS